MGLRIATNIASLNAQRSLAGSGREIQKSFAQLSSGSRITKSADDAAGLSISENLKSHIRGYQQASRNAQDGISMVQTAEGGLAEISNILTRFRELGVQASSDTVGDDERGFINKEVQQLKNEAERIARSTRFGKTALLDGSAGQFDFQVETLDTAQKQVNGYRANLGAIQNRLVSTTDNIGVAVENLSAANSRIRDTDVAAASAELAKNSILQTASTSIVAQANQLPQMALKLIG
jgi:flagellin